MAFDKIKKALFTDMETKDSNSEEEFYTLAADDIQKDANKAGSKMILIEPRATSESQQIADHLKNRNSVVVNMSRVTDEQAKRIIDFLSGTVYAIGGDFQKIGDGIYLCTPKNVNVQGKITEENDKKNKDIDEEIDW